MVKEKYVLVGNGLNICLKDSYSWSNLLEEIAKKYNVDYNSELSMPFEFERILNTYLENSLDEETTKTSVVNRMKNDIASIIIESKLDKSAIHYELRKLNVDGFITTNYDHNLEKVFDSSYEYDGSEKNKYLFDKTAEINDKKFYHIHGIAGCNKSICLGYEHYIGIAEKERSELNTKKDNKPYDMNIKRILYGQDKQTNHSFEKFYTADIAIIGLNLDTSEIDIWWLLTHRAYLYNSNYAMLMSKELLNNNITYYDILCKDDKSNEHKKNIYSLLRSLHVNVRAHEINNDNEYKKTYKAIIREIDKTFRLL